MTTALLVIDIQESFRQRPTWAAVSDPEIAAHAGRLVDAARDRGDLVIWISHTESDGDPANPFEPANGYVRLIDGLAAQSGEPVLVKTSRNAFTSTNLQQLLVSAGVRELVICGIQTEQCCETTARLGADLGYDVTFVTEATATFPIAHRDAPADRPLAELLADPRTLGTDAIVERTEYALAGRFATIRTVDEVAGALTPVV